MAQFERDLKQLPDCMGRVIAEWTLNRLKPESRAEMPPVLYWEGEAYRPKRRSPTRNLNCLFRSIRIHRGLYESLAGICRPALFPLEHALGIVAGVATPALAEVVARLSAEFTQRQVLATLLEQHHVRWGLATLRRVTTAVAGEIAGWQHAALVAQVLAWLKQAAATSGPVRLALAVGRDVADPRQKRLQRNGRSDRGGLQDRVLAAPQVLRHEVGQCCRRGDSGTAAGRVERNLDRRSGRHVRIPSPHNYQNSRPNSRDFTHKCRINRGIGRTAPFTGGDQPHPNGRSRLKVSLNIPCDHDLWQGFDASVLDQPPPRRIATRPTGPESERGGFQRAARG